MNANSSVLTCACFTIRAYDLSSHHLDSIPRNPIEDGLASGSPSFQIRGAGGTGAGANPPALRLDRINSRALIRTARSIYFRFLESSPANLDPVGVVMAAESGQGRVVFDLPVLLSDEHFLPIELLRNRAPSRGRISRTQSSKTQNGKAVPVVQPMSSPVSTEDPKPGNSGRAS